MRALWRELVPDDRLDTAYAFDSVALELAFIVGPLLAAGLATAWTPLAGMVVSAAFYSVAAIGFATAPASRAWRPEESVGAHARRSACAPRASGRSRSPPRCAAVAFGALEVALTAFAEEQGSRGAVGPLITVWSIGSLVGGLVYGARTWSSPASRRFLILSGLLGLGARAAAVRRLADRHGRVPVRHGPRARAARRDRLFAARRRWRPPGTATEAYSWHIVANVVGSSIGAFLAGLLDRPRERGVGARKRLDLVRARACWSAWPAGDPVR